MLPKLAIQQPRRMFWQSIRLLNIFHSKILRQRTLYLFSINEMQNSNQILEHQKKNYNGFFSCFFTFFSLFSVFLRQTITFIFNQTLLIFLKQMSLLVVECFGLFGNSHRCCDCFTSSQSSNTNCSSATSSSCFDSRRGKQTIFFNINPFSINSFLINDVIS